MITIPKPCHENWNDMTPKEKGRLCDKCCKVVVDFTQKTTEQIVDFLTANSGQKTCGRFRGDQVAVPLPVIAGSRPKRYRVFLAALYFVFGGLLFTSCGSDREEVMGKPTADNQQQFLMGDTTEPAIDTPSRLEHPQPQDPKQMIMGKVAAPQTDTTKPKCTADPNTHYEMGEVMMFIPEPDSAKTKPEEPRDKDGKNSATDPAPQTEKFMMGDVQIEPPKGK